MSRIKKLFANKQKNILSMYCTAGYPELNSTVQVLNALQKYGADIVEVGMPYSDPIADGPIIQQSNSVALHNGMTIAKLFEQLRNLKNLKNISTHLRDGGMPLILMGYLNPVMQYGFEKFCSYANKVGVDGIILPDLPLHEFKTQYQNIFQKNNLDFIFLITPQTSADRIRKIDKLSSGFIYAVSSSSTTGCQKDFQLQQTYFKKLQQMNLKNPVLAGFGIKDKQTFNAACKYTNGAIIGSAYIKVLERCTDINNITRKFLNEILN